MNKLLLSIFSAFSIVATPTAGAQHSLRPNATFTGYFSDSFALMPDYMCPAGGPRPCGVLNWAGQKFIYSTGFAAKSTVSIDDLGNIFYETPLGCSQTNCGNTMYVGSRTFNVGLAEFEFDIGQIRLTIMDDGDETPRFYWSMNTPESMYKIRKFDRPDPNDYNGVIEIRNGTHFFGNDAFARDLTVAISGAVPEPSSWLSMIFGFGIVGGALRIRQRLNLSDT